MQPKLEDFRHLVPEETLNRLGPLKESWPKWNWDRSPWSQMGIAAVSLAVAVALLVVSFQVVVSDKPDEQLPFQQAMWGLAGSFGVLMLYGLGTALWRAIFGIASVGQWWLLLERGLIIVSSGKLQTAAPLDELRIKSSTSLTGQPQLLDGDGRSLSLPLRTEEKFILAVQEQQRQTRRQETTAAPAKIPFAQAWAEAKFLGLLGEDSVFRIYRDGQSLLLIYAGQFLPEKMGLNKGFMPGAAGLVGGLATAYGDWIVGKDFEKRAAWLDAMTIEELRVEAHNNDASRILTASTTTDINIGFPETKFWSNDYLMFKVTGCLSFKHKGKKVQVAFFTEEERNFTVKALREIFGRERVVSQIAIA